MARRMLKGDPGSGKTTLLRHLACTLADAGGKPGVPVFQSPPSVEQTVVLLEDACQGTVLVQAEVSPNSKPSAKIRELKASGATARALGLPPPTSMASARARDPRSMT